MKRTLLAIGIAVLVSMMVAPHLSPVEGYPGGYGAFCSRWSYTGDYIGDRVIIDKLVLQTAFLAVLFAVVVNIRWKRKPKQ